jgi:signal transduction histidine kinase
VIDAGIYSEMFENGHKYCEIELMCPISEAIDKLKTAQQVEQVQIIIELDPASTRVQGRQEDLVHMFYYLLQNSIESVDSVTPFIKISSRQSKTNTSFIEVEIFNNGSPPGPKEMDNLFIPFYSSKPYGTGLGLPIAQLAARKNLGELYLEPVENQGTKCVIILPVSTMKKSSGF